MSDVVKFPFQKTEKRGRCGEVARRDEIGTSALSNLVDGAMSFDTFKTGPLVQLGMRQRRMAAGTPRDKASHSKGHLAGVGSYDWTNQELATLFRINRLLNLAELTIETDRGVTDEGDPWFVFLDPKGEVFVHLCRIGATYMLDSPCQNAVVQGDRLNDLVEAYIQQKGMTQARKPQARKNIIRLADQLDRKVTVHPAAALAALIWTIYLQSDELDASTWSEDDSPHKAMPDAPVDSLFFDTMTVEETASFSLAEEAALLSAEAQALLGADPDHAEKSVNLTLPANYVGMGLSALALTYGLDPFIGALAEDTKLFASSVVEAKAKSIAADQKSLETMLLSISGADWNILQDFGDQAEGIWSSLLDFDLFASSLINPQVESIASELMKALEITASLLTAEQLSTGPLMALKVSSEVFSSMRAKALAVEEDSNKLSLAAVKKQSETLDEMAYSASAPLIDMAQSSGESGFFQTNALPSDVAAVLQEYGFSTGGNVVANADASMAQAYLSDLEQRPAKSRTELEQPSTGQYDKYDQTVSDFITFLMLNADDIQMISYETELVIIDEATLHLDSTLTYMKSWDLDDGGRISTIGLKADFEAFDLIA